MTAMKPVRRSQAISPFGVGAMVDFPGPTSLVHAALDAWPVDPGSPGAREFRIDDEPRLARRLGVDFFMMPPEYREARHGVTVENPGLRLPFLRFPLWHVCPACGRMHRSRFHDKAPPQCEGPVPGGADGGRHRRRKTVQVRFVAACGHGHLQDFPWLEWLRLEDPGWAPDGQTRWLRLRSTGLAGMEGVEIVAEERDGAGIRLIGRRTLAGAVGGDPGQGASPLTRAGVRCTGQNPVLARGPDQDHGCGADLYVLLRGASNLYFSDVVSSIYVPELRETEVASDILELLEDYAFRRQLLLTALERDDGRVAVRSVRIQLRSAYPEATADPDALADVLNRHYLKDLLVGDRRAAAALVQLIKSQPGEKLEAPVLGELVREIYPDWDIDPVDLLPQVLEWFRRETGGQADSSGDDGPVDEISYRQTEYDVFCRDVEEGSPKLNLMIRSRPTEEYGNSIRSAFDRISLLHKLRETRAFRGFSRIFSGGLTDEQRWDLIATRRLAWLPAIIVRGEGIFLRLRAEALQEWEQAHGEFHRRRLKRVNDDLAALRRRRQQDGMAISPRYVLLHTLAHLLINELVYECGYGSASLRERIYCSEGDQGMSGVLIYTAAGDSEGTMGGLVRMGLPGLLDRALERMLERAGWCSSDPVCIESKGQGPDNCNLAACHGCALLPETSCEQQNRLLDRGVITGTLTSPGSGFFRYIAGRAASAGQT